jgi:hypothetical protein
VSLSIYINKCRAKAQDFRSFNNHGLKAVVIDNEIFMDFSPQFINPDYLTKPISTAY